MTRILVLGGTGPTGQQVIAQALERGHEVTAFTRSPAKFAVRTADRICVLRGTLPDDARALSEALRGQDAVISTLGTGTSLKPEGLIARIMPVLVEAMQIRGVRRLVFTSAYGVGETMRDVPFMPRFLIGLFLKDIYADKAAGEEVLRRSEPRLDPGLSGDSHPRPSQGRIPDRRAADTQGSAQDQRGPTWPTACWRWSRAGPSSGGGSWSRAEAIAKDGSSLQHQ